MRPITLAVGGGVTASPVAPLDLYISPFNVTLQAIVTGVVDYTVRYTKDDVFSPTFNPATAQWTNITGMTNAVADAEETLVSPVTGIQIILNSGAGSVVLRVLQAGLT